MPTHSEAAGAKKQGANLTEKNTKPEYFRRTVKTPKGFTSRPMRGERHNIAPFALCKKQAYPLINKERKKEKRRERSERSFSCSRPSVERNFGEFGELLNLPVLCPHCKLGILSRLFLVRPSYFATHPVYLLCPARKLVD